MFGKILAPDTLNKSDLDDYLEKGWYRLGQTIFTCNILNFNQIFYNAIWLRLPLAEYIEESTFKKLKKLNAGFKIVVQPATITQEKENLFNKYKSSVAFETASCLVSLLLDEKKESIFDTREICIYDQDKLIAVGYFDLGQNSMAGIVSFYDPDYKKHSLGRYLIYNKIAYGLANGYQYFYPGYFAPNYPVFDYKLTIGKSCLKYLDIRAKKWLPYANFSVEDSPYYELREKLSVIETLLRENHIVAVRFKYEYYNAANMIHFKDLDLFDYPEFLFARSPNFEDFAPIIVFDPVQQVYKMVEYVSYYFNEAYESSGGYYGDHLLKISDDLVVSADENVLVNALLSSHRIKNQEVMETGWNKSDF